MSNATWAHEDTGTSALSRRPLPGRLRYWLCIVVAGIVLVLDQATKVIAEHSLTFGQSVDSSLPLVEWQLVYNDGGAFGVPGFTGMFVVVTLAVIVLVAKALPRADRLSMALAYGLVSGGALGNVGDRLFRAPGFPDGEVVDFIALGMWPNFNLADVAIVVGAGMIVVLLWRVGSESRELEEAASGRESVRPGPTGPAGPTGPQGDGIGRGRFWMSRPAVGATDAPSADESR